MQLFKAALIELFFIILSRQFHKIKCLDKLEIWRQKVISYDAEVCKNSAKMTRNPKIGQEVVNFVNCGEKGALYNFVIQVRSLNYFYRLILECKNQ